MGISVSYKWKSDEESLVHCIRVFIRYKNKHLGQIRSLSVLGVGLCLYIPTCTCKCIFLVIYICIYNIYMIKVKMIKVKASILQ